VANFCFIAEIRIHAFDFKSSPHRKNKNKYVLKAVNNIKYSLRNPGYQKCIIVTVCYSKAVFIKKTARMIKSRGYGILMSINSGISHAVFQNFT
jgi:hypothetical protein